MESTGIDEQAAIAHTREQRQRDIEFGNTFRLEYIKHQMTLAAGVFAFTVTFTKDYAGKTAAATFYQGMLITGWTLLLVSLVAGIYHLRCWASFFTSWGGRDGHERDAVTKRVRLDKWRRMAECVQISTFLSGLTFLIIFAAMNLSSGVD